MKRYFRILRSALGFIFLAASLHVRRGRVPTGRTPLYVFGFSKWKTFISDWFPDHDVIFAPTDLSPTAFNLGWKWLMLREPRTEVLSWQYKGPPQIKEFCQAHKIPFHYAEDGFLRSIGLGALHVPPMSLVFDRQDVHFVADAPTDLETILATYDFDGDPVLMERARRAIKVLLDFRLSKYNSGMSIDINQIYGKKTRKRILVVGQVERDASIAYGCHVSVTNNDLVLLSRRENPDAEIIYKPHPEVLEGIAPVASNPDDVRSIARVIDKNISLADSLFTIDHVYTITSLSGFEALLRGIKVTTIGCPFYSGWGLTDDRQPNCRRKRKLSIEQLFAGSYILYPRYFSPEDFKNVEIEDVLSLLSRHRTAWVDRHVDQE